MRGLGSLRGGSLLAEACAQEQAPGAADADLRVLAALRSNHLERLPDADDLLARQAAQDAAIVPAIRDLERAQEAIFWAYVRDRLAEAASAARADAPEQAHLLLAELRMALIAALLPDLQAGPDQDETGPGWAAPRPDHGSPRKTARAHRPDREPRPTPGDLSPKGATR